MILFVFLIPKLFSFLITFLLTYNFQSVTNMSFKGTSIFSCDLSKSLNYFKLTPKLALATSFLWLEGEPRISLSSHIMETNQVLIKHPELYIENPEAELPSKHHMIARLDALGFTPTEICRKLEIANGTFYAVSKSPLYKLIVKRLKNELDKATTKALNVLIEAAPEASEKIVHLMRRGESERTQKECAIDILKGTGTIHADDKGADAVYINISDSKIALIINTLKELK